MKPCLPQHDLATAVRRNYIDRNHAQYQYDYEYLKPMALMDGGIKQAKIPAAEKFSTIYTINRLLTRIYANVNAKLYEWRAYFDPIDELADYPKAFTFLPKPMQIIQTYLSDQRFAEQRLSGANPMAIRWLRPEDDRAQILQPLTQNPKIADWLDIPIELAQGNLYITDYTGLADDYTGPLQVEGGEFAGRQKYLPKCRGFFWWNGDQLMPLAIQLEATDRRLYTKFDPELDWFYAKLCLQVADGNHHELSSHLGHVHLVMEPFAIATSRQLAENHPLSLLLRPHFRFMLRNNNLAHDRLINPDGPVDHVMAGTRVESLEVVKQSMQNWRFDAAALPIELADRGMNDTTRLPHYPYRDDALLLWEAIGEYVSDYVGYFYPDDATVQQDSELQAWAKEITAEDGGRIKGLPTPIETVEQLISVMTNLLFIVGPQHAAVNFAQYDYMTFALNMPLAAYIPPIARDVPITPQDILDFLPNDRATSIQLRILYLLGAYRYDRLGDYKKTFKDLYKSTVAEVFADTPIPIMIAKFQQQLNLIEQTIDRANADRLIPYPYLKPSLIPNSTSI
jgi:arachidonate 15-lipoxygenase